MVVSIDDFMDILNVDMENRATLEVLKDLYENVQRSQGSIKIGTYGVGAIGNAIVVLETLKTMGIMEDETDIVSLCRNLKRYFEYACGDKGTNSLESLHNHFERIDEYMDKVTVGTLVYDPDPYDYHSLGFPQRVIQIIDRDNGIIMVEDTHDGTIKEGSVLAYHLEGWKGL